MPALRHMTMLRQKTMFRHGNQVHVGLNGTPAPPVATGFGATRIAIPIGIGLALLLMILR